MPINTGPQDVEHATVIRQTITADKLHLDRLLIDASDPDAPRVEVVLRPYAEAADGTKMFGEATATISTRDLYAAAANMAGKGKAKLGQAMQPIFDAAAELVEFMAARKAAHDEAVAAEREAAAAFERARQVGGEWKDWLAAYEAAQARTRAAAAAAADPANPEA